ncbi:MAG: hypothetical protein ACLQNE_35480 [Thermoguttaceae bacterium]|jgi:hypothetical protein
MASVIECRHRILCQQHNLKYIEKHPVPAFRSLLHSASGNEKIGIPSPDVDGGNRHLEQKDRQEEPSLAPPGSGWKKHDDRKKREEPDERENRPAKSILRA